MSIKVVLDLLFIFLIYSFLGWILETTVVAIKDGKIVNRGITNGPLCPIYGLGALTIILTSFDIDNIFIVFIGSLIYGTFLEFITGKLLERVNKVKWWDYSKKKFNIDGYICLEYSILWGLLGVLIVKIINPVLMGAFNDINFYIRLIAVVIFSGIAIIDLITSFITIKAIKTDKIQDVSNRMSNWILKSVQDRIENAYPNFKRRTKVKEKSDNFASGVNFYKLFLVFLVGAFIGDIWEIVYCRFSMHRWMSRSSLIFGQLSIVWGLAMVLATLCLYKYRDRNKGFIFIFGSVMGGAFEYVCSVFTEFFFGTIFWDYSHLPLNLNGRINLLFCFFWGFAAIIFIKFIYPKLSNLIEKIPKKIGIVVTNILFVLFSIDLLITGCVMMRQHQRREGISASNIVEELCDTYANDEFMAKRWPNMKFSKKEN